MNFPQDGSSRWIGEYQVLRRLGAGGMGEVHLCRSPGGRLLAVKTVHPQFADDPEFRSRFTREVALSRRVGGAFTAPVVDAAPEADVPWLATVYVPGPSLREAVTAAGPMPEAVLRGGLAAGLVEALDAVHAADLTHRDLKPGNILLSSSGPRVIDFGIARAAESTAVTRTGQVVGTPGFMPPEQAEGRECTPAGDVFSLGAVLVFACTGTEPFGGGSVASVVYRLLHEEPDLSAVPGELRETLARCLAKTPEDRPSLAELRTRFAEGLSEDPGPPPLPAPVEAQIRRRETEARELLESGPYTPPPPAVSRSRWFPRPAPTAALAGGLVLIGAAGLLVLTQSGSGDGVEEAATRQGETEEAEEAAAEPVFSALEEPPAEPGPGLAETDVPIFEPLTGRPSPHLDSPQELRFAADGDMLVVLDEEHVAAFEMPSGEFGYELATPDAGHIAVSSDGDTVAVSEPGRIRMFDSRTGEEGEEIALGSEQRASQGIAFTREGEFLSLGHDAIAVWNPGTGDLLTTIRGTGHLRATGLATSSDGSLLAFGSSEGIEIWTVLGEQLAVEAVDPSAGGYRLSFQPETSLLVAHDGHAIHLWNAVSGERLAEIDVGTYVGRGLAVHPEGHYLIASGEEETLLIDLGAHEIRGEAVLPRPADAVPSDRDTVRLGQAVAFSPDGNHLAAAGSAGLFLWEVR